jgi:hypothetical protein
LHCRGFWIYIPGSVDAGCSILFAGDFKVFPHGAGMDRESIDSTDSVFRYSPPQPVILAAEEGALASVALKGATLEWRERADAMEALMELLLKREAIPKVRLHLFSDPNYAEVGRSSRQQVFESNGTRGKEIFRHPHFIPYLHHFIFGPDLPRAAVEGLCNILNDDVGTSGEVMDQYRRHARFCVRNYGLEPRKAATEFFRLGIEIGMEVDEARTLRDAARTTRDKRS